MKRNTWKRGILSAMLTAGCLCSLALPAAAYTVDEVAEKARECGYSEEMIQLGYNEWATGNYTQADLDAIYEQLCAYDDQADDMVDSIFENTSIPDDVVVPTNPPAEEDSSASEESTASGTTDSQESSSSGGTASGTVSSADFINMTLEEKIAYVNSMDEATREAFLDNLTAEERNSIIKQMSLDDKAELMQGYIDTAETMGLNVVVDSLTDTNISVTIRNQDGVIVDKAAVGVTIDETGISHTKLIVLAAAAVALSVLGLAALYRYLCRSDRQAQ